MHFSKIVAVLSFGTTIIASPALNSETKEVFELHKRTCGTLSGIALKLCQTACKATCNAVTGTLAKSACKKACEAGPLKARTLEAAYDSSLMLRSEPEEESEPEHVSAAVEVAELHKRTCGTLKGTPLKACQTACKIACTLVTGALAKEACTAACDAGPLRVREPEPVPEPMPEPAIGKTICKAACAVTCNSTVLALAQKKCLEVCNSKC